MSLGRKGAMHNDESRRRIALARRIAPVYAADGDVVAVIVGGSVARGVADCFSDLELGVFWATAPADAARAALADRTGAQGRRAYPPEPGDDGWDEDFTVDGLKVDLIHATVERTERLLADVTVRHDTSPAKLVVAGAIFSAIPLAGFPLVERWQRAAAYPDGLAVAVVRAHLGFGPTSYLRLLAERGDLPLLYDLFGLALRLLFGILLGLNRVYPSSTDLKWIRWVATQLPVAPHQLLDRCLCLFRDEPKAAVDDLHALILETISLVEAHIPAIETASIRARVAQRRQVW